MSFKEAVKDWIPPVLLRQIREGRRWVRNPLPHQPAESPEWEYVPQGWEADRGTIRGWDQPGVAETYAARWHQFQSLIAGTNPLGVSHEGVGGPVGDNVDAHNQVMTLAYVVGRTALRRERLAVFDYGGALGHHFAFLRALFPGFPLDYSCAELPHVAAQGRQLHPQVKYYTDDSWATRTFDLVLASNSLQYVPQWKKKLGQLAGVADAALFITKLPVVQKVPSFVMLQRADKYGYRTEYLGWCLNQTELIAATRNHHWVLEREFLVGNWEPEVVNAPERLRHKGFLFRREDTASLGE